MSAIRTYRAAGSSGILWVAEYAPEELRDYGETLCDALEALCRRLEGERG